MARLEVNNPTEAPEQVRPRARSEPEAGGEKVSGWGKTRMRHSEQRAAQHRRHKQATAAAATKALDPRVASGPEMDARMRAGARREEEDDAEEQARRKAEADRVKIKSKGKKYGRKKRLQVLQAEEQRREEEAEARVNEAITRAPWRKGWRKRQRGGPPSGLQGEP